MQNSIHPLADCPVSDYLLVLEPHEALRATIMALKQSFAERYEYPSAVHSKPHITLLRFMQFNMLESRIVQRLDTLIKENPSFVVELENFGSFPTHTIYIEVKTKTQITELVRSLRPVQRLLKFDAEHKPHFITEPHLTVARKLLPWQYEKGWLEFSNSHFSGRFMAQHVLLLRKEAGTKKYELVKRFELLNVKRVEPKQASLFF